MPPHLHPRSRSTTSLFGVTLLASFFIVGLPHVFPCPAPRHAFNDGGEIVDSEGQPQRIRRRKRREVSGEAGVASKSPDAEDLASPETSLQALAQLERENMARMSQNEVLMAQKSHECPVPKPRGVIGRMLGFQRGADEDGQ